MDSISLHALMRLFPLFCFSMQAASPACTELETVMLDWLGKMINLPEEFLAGKDGQGGGVIQVRADMKKEYRSSMWSLQFCKTFIPKH